MAYMKQKKHRLMKMNGDLEYVDDPFEDRFDGRGETAFQKNLLNACLRSKFRKPSEKKKAERIERLIDQPGTEKRPGLPERYVRGILEWARKKNAKAGFVKITLPIVMKMLLDVDRVGVYYEKHPEAHKQDLDSYGDSAWSEE
jgi:hypothetical protein